MEKIYGYIYKITHIPSGRYYIGLHRGDDPNDGYMGSGKVWKLIVKSHDPLEFKKEVLCFAGTRKELCSLEKEYIGERYKTDPLCKNCVPGGGAPPMVTEMSKEQNDKRQRSLRSFYRTEKGKAIASARNKGRKLPESQKKKIGLAHKGLRPSEETRKKMSMAAKNRTKRTLTKEQRAKISKAIILWHANRKGANA